MTAKMSGMSRLSWQSSGYSRGSALPRSAQTLPALFGLVFVDFRDSRRLVRQTRRLRLPHVGWDL
jgi:hypothetical protein